MNAEFFVPPERLTGGHVVLEPLRLAHARSLLDVGKDVSIWDWMPSGPLTDIADAESFIQRALLLKVAGEEFPFAVLEKRSGRIAGSTRFLEINGRDRGIEIGWTWYGIQYQRTGVNTECKLLLLQYAFEVLGAIRVQFKTDARNTRSQAAIKRIGAKYEGTLRNHRILEKDGYIRDSVYFSLIQQEWPAARENLVRLLAR